jgi:PAS domain S-box-containing protein
LHTLSRTEPADEDLTFLSAGGEMGALIRAHDWSKTSLGAPCKWPQPLRTAVRLILNCGHPMYIWWGADLLCFYNDAYRRSIGRELHPSSLGMPGKQVWAEIWHLIGPGVAHVMAGHGPTWRENQLVPITRDGKLEDVYWTYSYSPLDDPRSIGRVGGVLVVCSETTDAVMTAKQRADEIVRQREVFSQAPGFMIMMAGPEHRVEFVNETHRRLFNSGSWVGRRIGEAFSALSDQGFLELLDDVYRSGKPYRGGRVPLRYRRTDSVTDETRYLDFIYAPIQDPSGDVCGVFCEGFDVTQQIEAEMALHDRDEQLRLATDAADIGLWDYDLVADSLFWQPRVKAMFGMSAHVEVSINDFYASLHPEDRERTQSAFAAATNTASRLVYDVEYRTIGKDDGTVRWVAARGRGIFDDQGRCVRMIGTAMDISDRRKTEHSLRLTEEKLREADRRKDEFLATLAHELRNPLAPIRNAAALLQHPASDRAQIRRYAQMIERQTRAMTVLLDDLLEVSRITTGKLHLKRRAISVAVVVESALEPIRPALEAKEHALQVDMQGAEVLMEVDPVRLSQVITNLLNNAIKYCDRGGSIVLRTRSSTDEITFEVEDSGIGLSTEHISAIFDMFTQVSPLIDRAEGGLGIGLAVAKSLVELHGGRIEASSPGLGKGSKFTVVVPRGSARPVEAGAFSSFTPQATRHARAPVVVADDNADSADSLAALLGLEGYEVHVAHDGARALEIAAQVKPVACFLDIGMPGMNGYELAKRLRANANGEAMFLVAVTGWGKPEDVMRANEAGFDLHMTKPIDAFKAARALALRLGERPDPG